MVDGVSQTRWECIANALSIDPSNAIAWMEASKILRNDEKYIGKENHNAKTCLAKSIEVDGNNIRAYKKLYQLLSPLEKIKINGEVHTKQDIIEKVSNQDKILGNSRDPDKKQYTLTTPVKEELSTDKSGSENSTQRKKSFKEI